MSPPNSKEPKGSPPEPTEAPAPAAPGAGPTEEPIEAPSVESPPAKGPETDWEKSYRYLLADFENFRRRVDRERDQAVRAAQGKLLLRIIDLHEGIERVAASLPKGAETIREGLQLLLKNLDGLLRLEGVEPIAKLGDPFSTENHEAVGSIPAPDGIEPGAVAVIVQQGFKGPAGLLRPAKVLLAGSPGSPAEPGPEEPSASGPA